MILTSDEVKEIASHAPRNHTCTCEGECKCEHVHDATLQRRGRLRRRLQGAYNQRMHLMRRSPLYGTRLRER